MRESHPRTAVSTSTISGRNLSEGAEEYPLAMGVTQAQDAPHVDTETGVAQPGKSVRANGEADASQIAHTPEKIGEPLQKSAEFFEAIANTLREPLLVLDASLKVLAANWAFLNTFEVSRKETLQRPLYDLGNGQWNIPVLRKRLRGVFGGGENIADFEVRHDFETIGPRLMLLNAQRLALMSGAEPMILLVIEDITERRRIEEEAQRLQKMLEWERRIYDTTLSSISDFTYVFDREGRIVYVNKPLLDLWGMRLDEAVGKTFSELPYPRKTSARLRRHIRQVLKTGKSVTDEASYTNPRGEAGYYEHIFNPVFNGGKVELVAGSTRDLTERKRSETALIKTEKLAAAGRLAAALAHEINNPLQAVTNLLELIGQSSQLGKQERDYVAMATEELERISHLTRQSLSFFRENQTTGIVNIVVRQLLDSVLDVYRRRIEAKKITVTKRYDPEVVVVRSHAGEIRQIFAALLLNAIDAVPEGGTVEVRVRGAMRSAGRKPRALQFVVADNGPGISAGSRNHIFEPFFTTKGDLGTGLGLWVAQKIVKELGGTIRVRSVTRRGRSGAVFSVLLPVQMPGVPKE